MTLQEYIAGLARRFREAGLFYGHGTDNAEDEAFYLVFAVLEPDSSAPPEQWYRRQLQPEEKQRLEELARRRVEEHMPVAYLVGKAWFAGLAFHSDDRALVPRSPLAELIANRFASLLTREPARILDLCTGGGCIGIACAHAFPGARVELADISPDALALARENIQLHALGERLSVTRSDLFDGIRGRHDLIVCNPPYVSQEELSGLPPEYHREPALGLLADDNGLSIPLHILSRAASFLTAGGVLVLELGHSWQALQQRLPELPLLWLEFDNGGEGVLAIRREQLEQYEGLLQAATQGDPSSVPGTG